MICRVWSVISDRGGADKTRWLSRRDECGESLCWIDAAGTKNLLLSATPSLREKIFAGKVNDRVCFINTARQACVRPVVRRAMAANGKHAMAGRHKLLRETRTDESTGARQKNFHDLLL